MTKPVSGRGRRLERCYGLAARLMKGETLDRNAIASALELSPANADRHVKAITKKMDVAVAPGKDGITTIRAHREPQAKTVPNATVVAACFGASLARLFHGTAYEKRLKDVVAHVLESVRDVPRFANRERQFLFIPGGGERALRRKGAEFLDTIVDAILDNCVLRLKYVNFAAATETLVMQPLSLALHEHQLYVLGSVQGEHRIVRFSRVTAAMKLKERFEYPVLDDYDPDVVFRDSLGVFIRDDDERGIQVRKVQIRLTPQWSSYVKTHRWHESQRHSVDAHGVLLELRVRTGPELERLILGFGPDAEVISPPDLREKIAHMAAQLAAKYPTRRGRAKSRAPAE